MVQKEKNKKGGKISKKVRRFFSRSNQFLVAYNMSHEIKNLRSKLDKIAKDRQQFGLSDIYVPLKRREVTISFASEDHIIGRETDKEAIVGRLLGDSESSNDVDFVTIVGIGGLGKTALAQLVYNDRRIETAFEKRLWVCVSDDFVPDKIFRQMLGKDGSNIEELQREVRKLIQGKRYLLVLDDVWCESRDEWDSLKSFLNLGGRGSKIVVTSRSKKVARVAGDDLMYELKGLSEENSWKLFKRLAFKQGKEPVNSNDPFFDMGKEIVKKCVNVPLYIRVVGSMLYDQDESLWLSLRSANLMEIEQDRGGVMPILKYSYYHLSPALKSCFSYCALFPKDFEIEKEFLIRLWLAQGCLGKPHDCRSEEDVGEEYFTILLQRCFLQDAIQNSYQKIKLYKMHDLIHDLALEVSGKETTRLEYQKGQLDKRSRHLSLTANGFSLLANQSTQLREMKSLRTFLLDDERKYEFSSMQESSVKAICPHFRRLRVLSLRGCGLRNLPDTVGNLLQLRYLDLSGNRELEGLPDSITKLLNLLILNLDGTGIRDLPHDMRKLVNLRHLSLCYCYCLGKMPPGLDTMTSLQVLTRFVVGDETSKQGKIGKLRDLRALVNLRDELTIIFYDHFSCDVAEYEEVELLRLAPLKHLTIQFPIFSDQGAAIHETLLGCLQPHCRLLTISIWRYRGFKLPTWAGSPTISLPHLVSICLDDFNCLEMLPSFSQLHHLKNLVLRNISNVEFVESHRDVIPLDNQLTFFPSLEELDLQGFPKLKGWWREETSRVMGEACASTVVVPSFPRLRKLVLKWCPNLTAFPSCPKLKYVDLYKFHEALTLLGSKTTTPCNSTTSIVLHLEELEIDNVGALSCLFGETLGCIRQLSIRCFVGDSFPNLAAIGRLGYSIENLVIYDSVNLKSLSGFVEHLTGLQSLLITNCNNLELENNEDGVTVTSWKSLHMLSSLELRGIPKLVNLPKEFQYLTSLEHLNIHHCSNLEALPEWLNCLTSLQTLSITQCDKLKSLPEAIAHMPSLKTLNLWYSNKDLIKRCSEPDGEDWSKVHRIPKLLLDEDSDEEF